MRHSFTEKIMSVLGEHFDDYAGQVFDNSELIRYINNKTVSANRGSKSRSSFGNLYAIYVLVEDYLQTRAMTEEVTIRNMRVLNLVICIPDNANCLLAPNYRIMPLTRE